MWVVSALAILVGVYVLNRILHHSWKLPPGPISIPLLGSWDYIKLCMKNGPLEDLTSTLGAKYGPIVFFRTVFDTPVVVIRTYDAFKEAAKDVRLHGMSGTYFNQLVAKWNHSGVSMADGSKWHHNRKFTIATLGKLGFRKSPLGSFANVECSMVVDNLVQLEGQVIDIESELVGPISNITLQMIMGHQFDPYDPKIPELKEVIAVYLRILSRIQTRWESFLEKARLAGKSSDAKILAKNNKILCDFIEPIVEQHIETLDEAHPRDLIDAYLLQAPREGIDTSTGNLCCLLKDLLIASLVPSTLMFSWIVMLLAKHPDAQKRVRAELASVLGPDRPPTAADEHQCPYTLAVIEETLRFVTMTPINRHFATLGATTLHDYDIPAGAIILADQLSLHHDPAVWGDPQTFRPERFLGEDGARLREHVRGFGFGPRVCLAEAHSRGLMFAFTAGLLRRLEFRLPEEGQLVNRRVHFLLSRPTQTLVVPFPL